METYEQKYKEALETARKINSGEGVAAPKGWSIPEVIFPELKKSEDELIREELIDFLNEKLVVQSPAETQVNERWISWLEKQGERKTVDKVKSRFKVGDWVVFNTGSTYQVERIENYKYTLRHTLGGSMPLPFSSENLIKLWTIQDAKDGDILCYEDDIFLLKYYDLFSKIVCYGFYNKYFTPNHVYLLTKKDFKKIHPATIEQRDFLFKKMHELGYAWDSNKKELIRYE